MFVLLVTLSLAGSAFCSLLCPSQFNHEVTVHIAHPTDCGKFLTCVGSQPVEQSCPAGLYWNEQETFCDYVGSSRCSRDLPADHPKFNLSNSVCISDASRCPVSTNPNEGVVFLKHHNCRKFYACVSAQPVELSCPLNLYWNSKSCTCDYAVEEECEKSGERPEEPSEEASEDKDADHGSAEAPQGNEEPQPDGSEGNDNTDDQPDSSGAPDEEPQPEGEAQTVGDYQPEEDSQPEEDPQPEEEPHPEEDPQPEEDSQLEEDPQPEEESQPEEEPQPEQEPQPEEDPQPDVIVPENNEPQPDVGGYNVDNVDQREFHGRPDEEYRLSVLKAEAGAFAYPVRVRRAVVAASDEISTDQPVESGVESVRGVAAFVVMLATFVWYAL